MTTANAFIITTMNKMCGTICINFTYRTDIWLVILNLLITLKAKWSFLWWLKLLPFSSEIQVVLHINPIVFYQKWSKFIVLIWTFEKWWFITHIWYTDAGFLWKSESFGKFSLAFLLGIPSIFKITFEIYSTSKIYKIL